jgi:hypothetical protein
MVSSFIVDYWLDSHRYIAFASVDDLLIYAAHYSSRNEFHRTYKQHMQGEKVHPGLYDGLRSNLAGIARVVSTTRVYVVNGSGAPLLESSLEDWIRSAPS